MRQRLLAALAAPELECRLFAAAAGLPPAAPLSLEVDLGSACTDWLALLPEGGDYWYWAHPARQEWRLGLGTALQVASSGGGRFAALGHAFAGLVRDWRYEARPAAFVGFAFDEAARGELPNAVLAVPSLLLLRSGQRCRALLTTLAGEAGEACERWRSLLAFRSSPAPALPPAPPVALQPLARRAWHARVEAALRDIAAGRLAKVVLARSRRLAAPAPFAAAPVLAALLAHQRESTIYAYSGSQAVFLGASPECLVRLHDGLAEADALAGTVWEAGCEPAAVPGLDADKNRREQRLVSDAVAAALLAWCESVDPGAPPEVLALNGLSHLRSVIGGRVRPGTTLFDLIAALHPTPAVGGWPAADAREWLRRHGERRGAWYSGGIGVIDAAGDGVIAVALRSALLTANEAELQAGAGIVAGSQADLEFAETEAKMANLLAILCPPAASLERTGTR